MTTTKTVRLLVRAGTPEAWALQNPVLMFGEVGVAIEGGAPTILKVGNGSDTWSVLPGISGSGGGAGTPEGIRDALSTLAGNDRLDISKVKGLSSATSADLILQGVITGTVAETRRRDALLALVAGMVGPDEAIAVNPDATDIVGIAGMEGIAATPGFVAANPADVTKELTVNSFRHWTKQTTVTVSGATVTIDHTGDEPPHSLNMLATIADTSAHAFQINTFPAGLVGCGGVLVLRNSGGVTAGALTFQNMSGGASVEYKENLLAADFPGLPTANGKDVTVYFRIMSQTVWRITGFERSPA